jgi:hypothetical protein
MSVESIPVLYLKAPCKGCMIALHCNGECLHCCADATVQAHIPGHPVEGAQRFIYGMLQALDRPNKRLFVCRGTCSSTVTYVPHMLHAGWHDFVFQRPAGMFCVLQKGMHTCLYARAYASTADGSHFPNWAFQRVGRACVGGVVVQGETCLVRSLCRQGILHHECSVLCMHRCTPLHAQMHIICCLSLIHQAGGLWCLRFVR